MSSVMGTPVKCDLLSDDPQQIVRFAAEGIEAGLATALVTLCEIRGGAARALGSQMAVTEDGRYCGFVSGGCIEHAAACEALRVLKQGRPECVLFGEGSDWLDLVLPCGGGITLAIHPLNDAAPLRQLLAQLEARHAASLLFKHDQPGVECVLQAARTGWQAELLWVHYQPVPRLIVLGNRLESTTLTALAQAAGYHWVSHQETAQTLLAGGLDEQTAVLLLYHDIDREASALVQALHSNAFYIGALGSQRTHQRRVARLRDAGISEADIARIKAPVGIFAGARSARGLALSVLADIEASLTQA